MLSAEDILATDWEVEERKIEITEKDFYEAIAHTMNKCFAPSNTFTEELKKRLFER